MTDDIESGNDPVPSDEEPTADTAITLEPGDVVTITAPESPDEPAADTE